MSWRKWGFIQLRCLVNQLILLSDQPTIDRLALLGMKDAFEKLSASVALHFTAPPTYPLIVEEISGQLKSIVCPIQTLKTIKFVRTEVVNHQKLIDNSTEKGNNSIAELKLNSLNNPKHFKQ